VHDVVKRREIQALRARRTASAPLGSYQGKHTEQKGEELRRRLATSALTSAAHRRRRGDHPPGYTDRQG